MNTFFTPFGELSLKCDNSNDSSIQAWSQADTYLLNMLAQHPDSDWQQAAIINDEWGALSIATQSFNPMIYSDSAVFAHWLNLNTGPTMPGQTVHPVDCLSTSMAHIFLMRLPKNLHFFQHQLSCLSQLPDTTIYVAGMQKYWPASFFKTALDYFNDIDVFPGIKKAKCMRLRSGKNNTQPPLTRSLDIPEFNLKAVNYPNVFSRDSLDIGTRFFLENFPDLSSCENIIDIACGNGLLGIHALKKFSSLKAVFIDESHYATRSCSASLQANDIEESRYSVIQNDAMHGLQLPNFDAVLCNPPFHQLHRIGDHIANTLIEHSARHLKPGGSLYLIGNRHLQYHILLKKYFLTTEKVADNSKFILFKATL